LIIVFPFYLDPDTSDIVSASFFYKAQGHHGASHFSFFRYVEQLQSEQAQASGAPFTVSGISLSMGVSRNRSSSLALLADNQKITRSGIRSGAPTTIPVSTFLNSYLWTDLYSQYYVLIVVDSPCLYQADKMML
jgi:hypothetical protein